RCGGSSGRAGPARRRAAVRGVTPSTHSDDCRVAGHRASRISAMATSREIHLAARPHGVPEPTDFALVEVDVPEPADGEVLIRNAYMSVDPSMRPRMNDVKSYLPPFEVGEVMSGGAVGQVG